MTRLNIPQLDVNLLDVTISNWLKKKGDNVALGEIVAVLTTDKASYELESPAAGILLELYATEKSIIPINYTIALIGAPGDSDPTVEADNATIMANYKGEALPASAASRPSPRIRATARVRRIAQERGIDLAQVQAESGAAIIDEKVLAPYLEKTT